MQEKKEKGKGKDKNPHRRFEQERKSWQGTQKKWATRVRGGGPQNRTLLIKTEHRTQKKTTQSGACNTM